MIRAVAAALLATIVAGVLAVKPAPVNVAHPLIVHEWGTVTTRHTADGTQEGQLNRITSFFEPLPAFVHRYDPGSPDPRRIPLVKGDVTGRGDVTMRLETPVLYFHPAPGDSIPPFDVSVDFRGGVLNEFYPKADATAHGWNGGPLRDSDISSLTWHDVTLHDHVDVRQTYDHVWLAPRAVHSEPLTIGGESEQYIFYRGLAHLQSVLRTRFAGSELRVFGPEPAPWFTSPTVPLGRLWLVDVRPNGIVAFHETDSLTLARGDTTRELARLRDFAQSEYSSTALDSLRASMERTLVGRGLYPDEAHAMLETWKRSYFTEPGLRLFYIVPSEWVTYHLPIRISIPHTLTRVIVGRIELPQMPTP